MSKAHDAYLVAYQKFKLEWMLKHGYTMEDLVKGLDIVGDKICGLDIAETFEIWERDVGFGSEIWPSFAEWQECEAKEAEKSTSTLKEKLERCLKIAESREDLSCHINQIKIALDALEAHPYTANPMMEVWSDYFLKKNEPAGGMHKLHLTCPRCGKAEWIRKDDGWECAACGEFAYPEDMGAVADDEGGDEA